MKWNSIIWITFVFLILIVMLIFGGINKGVKNKNTRNYMSIDSLEKTIFFTKEALLNQIVMSGEEMVELSKYIKDTIKINNRPMLIYRYSSTMCEYCINLDLKVLLEYRNKIGKDHILILPAFGHTRDSQIKVKSSLHSFNYFDIEEDKVAIPTDVYGISHRFFAIFDNCNHLKYVYYPSKNCMDMTYTYMENLTHEFGFSNDQVP